MSYDSARFNRAPIFVRIKGHALAISSAKKLNAKTGILAVQGTPINHSVAPNFSLGRKSPTPTHELNFTRCANRGREKSHHHSSLGRIMRWRLETLRLMPSRVIAWHAEILRTKADRAMADILAV